MPKAAAPKRFEELLDRLEAIVRALESEELDLDRSLHAFEEGVALARQCHERLDAAERRVEVLRRGPGSSVLSEPFAEEAE